MRIPTIAGVAGIALVCLAACSKPASTAGAASSAPAATPAAPASGPLTAETMPHRKPGLWRQSMVMEGVNTPMPTVDMCLDAVSEAKMSMFGQNMRKGHCEREQINRNLDGSMSFDSSCDFGPGGKTVSHGTLTGDFNSGYKLMLESSHGTGPATKMTLTSTWMGPCAPGQKGGDVIMPGGRVMNMTQ